MLQHCRLFSKYPRNTNLYPDDVVKDLVLVVKCHMSLMSSNWVILSFNLFLNTGVSRDIGTKAQYFKMDQK